MNFDLNKPPPYDEEIPPRNIVIELNDDRMIRSPVIEIDLNQLHEDDGTTSDSSDEEIVVQTENNGMSDEEIVEQTENHGVVQGRKRRVLTNAERWAIYRDLLAKSVDGTTLKRSTTHEVQQKYNIKNVRTVQRIWEIHKKTEVGKEVDVSSKRTRNCGRKRIEVDLSLMEGIELSKRTTLTSLAEALKVKYTTLYRLFKKGFLRRHSSAIKPYLREDNKTSRLEFFLSMIEESTSLDDPKFKGMFNYVHIDEKWFYLSKKNQTFYLLPHEDDPDRMCQNKNFIAKVMFLVAVARPRFDNEGRMVFSGKIGCWPFIFEREAQRNSRNRRAGTTEIKAITSVTRDISRKFLIEKVIPAIHEKWPRSEYGETIFIQQDNARTHVLVNDPDFIVAATQNGWDIRLTCQPPNSPDMNILDLGFFRAIQSLQQKIRAKTIAELVLAVEKAFNEYSPLKLNHVWLTLQLCMKETMKHGGGNRYKIPHINKKRLQRLGRLPKQITCERTFLQATRDFLSMRMGTGPSGTAEQA